MEVDQVVQNLQILAATLEQQVGLAVVQVQAIDAARLGSGGLIVAQLGGVLHLVAVGQVVGVAVAQHVVQHLCAGELQAHAGIRLDGVQQAVHQNQQLAAEHRHVLCGGHAEGIQRALLVAHAADDGGGAVGGSEVGRASAVVHQTLDAVRAIHADRLRAVQRQANQHVALARGQDQVDFGSRACGVQAIDGLRRCVGGRGGSGGVNRRLGKCQALKRHQRDQQPQNSFAHMYSSFVYP